MWGLEEPQPGGNIVKNLGVDVGIELLVWGKEIQIFPQYPFYVSS